MKICMPPRRRLLSWPGSCMLPRRCRPSWFGLAAACKRRWRLGWGGPGGGPAGVLDEGLVGWPGKGLAVACCRPRQGPCRGSGGLPRQGSCRESSSSDPHLILNMSSQRSACHHRGASRALAPRDDCVGDRGLKSCSLCWCGVSCPGKGLARGNLLRPSALCGLGLGVALIR